jgi:hypothetical protein
MPKCVISSVTVDSRWGDGKKSAVSRQAVHRVCQQGQLALQHIWLFVMNWGRHDDSHGYPNILPNQNTYMNSKTLEISFKNYNRNSEHKDHNT